MVAILVVVVDSFFQYFTSSLDISTTARKLEGWWVREGLAH